MDPPLLDPDSSDRKESTSKDESKLGDGSGLLPAMAGGEANMSLIKYCKQVSRYASEKEVQDRVLSLLHRTTNAADIDLAEPKRGLTALHYAIQRHILPLVRQLVRCGASVSIADYKGRTALKLAAVIPDRAFLEVVLSSDDLVEIDTLDAYRQRNALMCAVSRGYEEHVQLLLRYGADPSIVSDVLGNVVTIAARCGHYFLVSELVSTCGVDVDVASKDGQTALMCAVEDLNFGMVEFLLQVGASPNKQNMRLECAVTLAATNIDMFLFLTQALTNATDISTGSLPVEQQNRHNGSSDSGASKGKDNQNRTSQGGHQTGASAVTSQNTAAAAPPSLPPFMITSANESKTEDKTDGRVKTEKKHMPLTTSFSSSASSSSRTTSPSTMGISTLPFRMSTITSSLKAALACFCLDPSIDHTVYSAWFGALDPSSAADFFSWTCSVLEASPYPISACFVATSVWQSIAQGSHSVSLSQRSRNAASYFSRGSHFIWKHHECHPVFLALLLEQPFRGDKDDVKLLDRVVLMKQKEFADDSNVENVVQNWWTNGEVRGWDIARFPWSVYHTPRTAFVLDAVFYAVYLLLLSLLLSLGLQVDDPIHPLETAIFTCFAFGFVANELLSMLTSVSMEFYFAESWNGYDVTSIVLLWVLVAVRIHNWSEETRPTGDTVYVAAMVSLSILSWIRSYFIFGVLESLGTLSLSLFHMGRDIARFAVLLVVFLLGFYFAFLFVVRSGNEIDGFDTNRVIFTVLFQAALSGEPPTDFSEMNFLRDVFGNILTTLFMLVISIVLLNMLIAMMASSYDRVAGNAQTEFLFLRIHQRWRYLKSPRVLPAPLNLLCIALWILVYPVVHIAAARQQAKKRGPTANVPVSDPSSAGPQQQQEDPSLLSMSQSTAPRWCSHCHREWHKRVGAGGTERYRASIASREDQDTLCRAFLRFHFGSSAASLQYIPIRYQSYIWQLISFVEDGNMCVCGRARSLRPRPLFLLEIISSYIFCTVLYPFVALWSCIDALFLYRSPSPTFQEEDDGEETRESLPASSSGTGLAPRPSRGSSPDGGKASGGKKDGGDGRDDDENARNQDLLMTPGSPLLTRKSPLPPAASGGVDKTISASNLLSSQSGGRDRGFSRGSGDVSPRAMGPTGAGSGKRRLSGAKAPASNIGGAASSPLSVSAVRQFAANSFRNWRIIRDKRLDYDSVLRENYDVEESEILRKWWMVRVDGAEVDWLQSYKVPGSYMRSFFEESPFEF